MKLMFDLKVVKAIIEANTEIKTEIKEVYWDFGAGIKHVNLIAPGPDCSPGGYGYQLLNYNETRKAAAGIMTIEEVQEIVEKINERGW